MGWGEDFSGLFAFLFFRCFCPFFLFLLFGVSKIAATILFSLLLILIVYNAFWNSFCFYYSEHLAVLLPAHDLFLFGFVGFLGI